MAAGNVRDRLVTAMDAAVGYYNCYSDLSHELTVNYNAGVPTAEANVDGWMSFGSSPAYMVVATAMHEIGHTLLAFPLPGGGAVVPSIFPAPPRVLSELVAAPHADSFDATKRKLRALPPQFGKQLQKPSRSSAARTTNPRSRFTRVPRAQSIRADSRDR